MATLREEFQRLRMAAEPDVDVAWAALLVARCEKPVVALESAMETVDLLAAEARAAVGDAQGLHQQADALVNFLCAERGFIGATDYYQRSNSYLDEVLVRREGIPITLAVVYLAVGRRLGLNMAGINFPGHFLVSLSGPAAPGASGTPGNSPETVLIDPFAGAQTSLQACAARLPAAARQRRLADSQIMAIAPSMDIVARMLNNLKWIDIGDRAWESALTLSDRILWLFPDQPSELHDRALILEQLGSFDAAVWELRRLRQLLPDAATRRALDERIQTLRQRAGEPPDRPGTG